MFSTNASFANASFTIGGSSSIHGNQGYNQAKISTLEKSNREMREFLEILTEGLVIKKQNEKGEIKFITFKK